MKKLYIALLAFLTIVSGCNKDMLETNPTTSVSGSTLLETTDGGYQALNGAIRWFWQWGMTVSANAHQSFGPQSYALMGDLMGEDMVMAGQGSGWFWYDYVYNVKARYTSSAWRSYDCWNFYYTLISQVNYIIAAAETMQGAQADKDYILGNAYAFRAYAYHYLAMTFARSYIGHEDMLCVPILEEPTTSKTTGQPRSTNRKVYELVMTDIDKAIGLLEGKTQKHCSHIDYYVANGIKARAALYMGNYQAAYDAAKLATGGRAKLSTDILKGFNNAKGPDVMWGAEIILDQGTTNPQFLAHMDWTFDGYGNTARKCCSKWLYEKIPANDIRQSWWRLEALHPNGYVTEGYQQYKFRFVDVKTPQTGADHIFMRVPEMYLTMAECACRLNNYTEAQTILNDFMTYRMREGATYDCSSKTGNELGNLTTDLTGSLLEEILLQRRIELWGEFGRVYDIKRLRQGFKRTSDTMGHPAQALVATLKTDDPDTFDWVLTIPQAELDANPIVQNPLSSTAEGSYGDDPSLANTK